MRPTRRRSILIFAIGNVAAAAAQILEAVDGVARINR
jgi:hypothetical protein